MSKAALSVREKQLRAQLTELLREQPVMRATLSLRKVTCGKPNCRCATGQKHRALYVVYSKDGKLHQVFVPRVMEPQVRKWVRNYRRSLELLEKLSELARKNLRSRKK